MFKPAALRHHLGEPPLSGGIDLVRLFATALRAPSRAVDIACSQPGAAWGFKVVVGFNLAIALSTTLALAVSGAVPEYAPVLRFIPPERYYLAEMFFLPLVRVGIWWVSAAIIHLGLGAFRHPSTLAGQLNLGALVNLVVMPFIFALDWSALALGFYQSATFRLTHGFLALCLGCVYSTLGVRRLSGAPLLLALGLVLLSLLATVPVLAVLAR